MFVCQQCALMLTYICYVVKLPCLYSWLAADMHLACFIKLPLSALLIASVLDLLLHVASVQRLVPAAQTHDSENGLRPI